VARIRRKLLLRTIVPRTFSSPELRWQKNAAAEAAALFRKSAALEVEADSEFNVTRRVGEVAAV